MKGVILLDRDARIRLYSNKLVYGVDIFLYNDLEHAVFKNESHMAIYYRATTGRYYPLHNIPFELFDLLRKDYSKTTAYNAKLI